jgi:nanoRNase/pAp phosphatase (c-di-AMP/oligoRNAs hydrolase)
LVQTIVSSTTDQLRLESLLDAVQGMSCLVILTHNDPDPDAIAGALALRYVVETLTDTASTIVYGGIVGRAENRALVKYLALEMRLASELEWSTFDGIALVDSQPGAGNNALPPDRRADIVFDHHQPFREQTSLARHADVRLDIGASSTILARYILAAGLEIYPELATALFYGIQTDTMGLSRGADDSDRTVYAFLQSLVDVEGLVSIERAQVSREYFKAFARALEEAEVYDGTTVVAHVGEMHSPDMAAEMSDVLMRLQGVEWVLCSGFYGSVLLLSLRSNRETPEAGVVAQDIVKDIGSAGGHGTVGGGQVPLGEQSPGAVVEEVERRFFETLGFQRGPGERLIRAAGTDDCSSG